MPAPACVATLAIDASSLAAAELPGHPNRTAAKRGRTMALSLAAAVFCVLAATVAAAAGEEGTHIIRFLGKQPAASSVIPR